MNEQTHFYEAPEDKASKILEIVIITLELSHACYDGLYYVFARIRDNFGETSGNVMGGIDG